jgi:hypothetical protein
MDPSDTSSYSAPLNFGPMPSGNGQSHLVTVPAFHSTLVPLHRHRGMSFLELERSSSVMVPALRIKDKLVAKA